MAVRLLARTLEIRREEATVSPLWAAGTPVIYAVWHGRILLLPYLYGWRRARVLASRSRDGELVTRFVRRFGLEAVRGSSSRGGAEALRSLARSLGEGRDAVVVPDGPRGPRETVKPGIVALARVSGAPIVPIGPGRFRRVATPVMGRVPDPAAFRTMRAALRRSDPGAG